MNTHLTKFNGNRPASPAWPQNAIEVKSPINFRQALQLLRERWWLLLLVASSVAIVTAHFVSRIPPKYTTKAVLQVELEEQRLIGDDFSGEDLRPSEVLNTIVQNIKNTSVLRRVVRENRLSSNPDFLPGKKYLTELQLIRALSGMVTAKLRQDTRLIEITVSHRNSGLAEKLANSIATEFIRQNLDDRFSTTKAANELLYQEAAKLKQKLEASETRVQAYKESHSTVSLEERQNIIVEKLKELNQKYTEAKSERLRKEADFKQIERIKDNPEAILLLPGVREDPAISDLRRKIVEQEANVATLSLRYKPMYPKMMQAQRQLDDLKTSLHHLALRIPASVQAGYEVALARENNLQAAIHDTQLESLDLDKKGIAYNVLLREVQSDRALYDSVLKRLKETDISKGLERAAIALVEPALVPVVPVELPVELLTVGAFFLSLLGTFGLLYLARATDTSIQTVDQAETLLGLPVWAAIPAARNGSRKVPPHVISESPNSNCSESFRTLRTTTIISRPARKKLLLFTSADPAEGKSFCSVNHAICQAQEGKRTLLIDLDLRRPSIGESFSYSSQTPGVSDFLLGKKSMSELIQQSPYKNLFVLTAGPKVSNPAELLSQGAIKNLIEEASRDFDCLIIDTAPINAVSDTFLVLHLADVIYLVVRSGKTPRRAIQRAIALMARANVPPTGIVLNFLPARCGYRYHYYYAPQYDYDRETYDGESMPKALAN